MNSQEAFEFFAAFLESFQPCHQLVPTLIVPVKVLSALFAFKDCDCRFALGAIQANGDDIDSEWRSRSANFHRTTTEAVVIRPKKRLLLQVSVDLGFACGH